MTSLAFVLGVMPLMLSTGAGAGARRSMGTGVVGGMLAATFIALLASDEFPRWRGRFAVCQCRAIKMRTTVLIAVLAAGCMGELDESTSIRRAGEQDLSAGRAAGVTPTHIEARWNEHDVVCLNTPRGT